jgi:hypothetical protein
MGGINMSKYRAHESAVREKSSILEAIADAVSRAKPCSIEQAREIVEDNVKCYDDEPTTIFGYQGRTAKANIVCSPEFVRGYIKGTAIFDMGFILTDYGTYQTVIDDDDNKRWFAKASPRFWQVAMAEEAIKQASATGNYVLERYEEDDNIKIVAQAIGGGASSSHSGGAW